MGKKKKKGATAPLVAARRKKEVLGLILIALAVLLSLALVTYDPADQKIAQGFSFGAVLDPAPGQAHNALGQLGAALARVLVHGFLGYTMLLLTGLVGVWGYVVLRHRRPAALPLLSVLTAAGAFLLACLLGWFGQTLDADLLVWTGGVGLGTAGWMQHLFGATGSLILLVVLLSVTVLLAVDHDIQRSIDRFEAALRAVGLLFSGGLSSLGDRFRQFREERHARREARRQEREAQEQEAGATETASQNGTAAPTPSPPERKERPPREEHPLPTPRARSGARNVNEMYQPGVAPSPEEEQAAPPPERTAAEQPPRPPRPAPPTPEPTREPEPAEAAAPQEATEEPTDVAMEVKEQVEEETADDLQDTGEETLPEEIPYTMPGLNLLDEATARDRGADREELEENKRILLDKLGTYNVEIEKITAVVGPTVTRYELLPAPGIKVSRIKNLEDDLAMALAAQSIRVIAPIPGKKAVGVEIPNRNRELVRLRGVLGTKRFRDADMELPVAMGKSIEGKVFIRDLATMPHLLIAGATGSGKSVGINALLTSLLYARRPDELRFVLIDPKKIELQQYALLADHFIAQPEDLDEPVITDFDQALGVLKSCEKEMEQRYDLLSKASVRSISDYNRKLAEGRLPDGDGHRRMPYIVVVVDELADLMMTAGKEIEAPIARLAQMARAVGIHLVLATQRPSVDVITGIIKANFPSRMAYQVASRVDSRTILDQGGAEGLVGNGDLLYMYGSHLMRLQGPFVSLDEVERVTEAIAEQPMHGAYALPSLEDAGDGPDTLLGVDDTDELFEKAAHIIVRRQRGSVSLLQRKLSVGYTRAARIVDQLEEAGIVGTFAGTKAREVMVEDEEELERLLAGEDLSEEDGGPEDGDGNADSTAEEA